MSFPLLSAEEEEEEEEAPAGLLFGNWETGALLVVTQCEWIRPSDAYGFPYRIVFYKKNHLNFIRIEREAKKSRVTRTLRKQEKMK